MKKKLLLLGLILGISFALAGCSKKYVELGTYEGLELNKMIPEVTEVELQDEIDFMLNDNASEEVIKDRAAKKDDTANINFSGKVDGESFDGGDGENYDLLLGSNSFIDGMDEQVIGMKTGETKEITLSFPEEYGDPDLTGKPTVFTVTVNTIKIISTPEYNEEFVTTYTEFESTSDFEENLKNQLLINKQEEAESSLLSQALEQVISNSEFDGYPQELYDECKTRIESENAYFAELFGISVDDLYSSPEELTATVQAAVNEELTIEAIAKKENLKVTDEDYTKYLTENMTDMGYESAEQFEQDYKKEDTMKSLLSEKVMTFMVSKAVITEVPEAEMYGDDGEFDNIDDETDPPLETEANSEAES